MVQECRQNPKSCVNMFCDDTSTSTQPYLLELTISNERARAVIQASIANVITNEQLGLRMKTLTALTRI